LNARLPVTFGPVPGFRIAQLNVARLLAPLDTPALADFVDALDPVNALADAAPGFVWRLQTEDGDATAIRAFEDDMVIVNMSVWDSIAALGDFVFRSAHRDVMVRRREWFERTAEAYLVLWWVPEGHVPTVEEGRARLERLRAGGPGPDAFTFRQPFPPPGSDADADFIHGRSSCPSA
jgi:Domain of unknown function (DUF3291)